LQPVGGGAVLHPAHEAPGEDGASVGASLVEIELDGDGIGEASLHRLDRVGLELAESGRGEIARDAAHPEAVRAVRRDRHLEHRIVEPERLGRRAAYLGVGRQLDDADVLVRQFELALRQQHAARLHTADLGSGEGEIAAGHMTAHGREHALHAGARIGRAAYHLHAVGSGIHLAHAELVGVGVLLAFQHLRHFERRKRGGGIEHFLHFQPDAGQRVGDLAHARFGGEMILQPAEREFHGCALRPPASVGTASGGKP
jgi:hypothetical protein